MDAEYRGDGSIVDAGENLDCSTGRLRWPGGRVSERCSRNLLICECDVVKGRKEEKTVASPLFHLVSALHGNPYCRQGNNGLPRVQ